MRTIIMRYCQIYFWEIIWHLKINYFYFLPKIKIKYIVYVTNKNKKK